MCQEHGWENGRVSPRSTHRARLKPHPSWEKVDGWRMLAYKAGDRVRLVSRNGRNHTRRVADLAAAIAKLSPRALVLDGEVAIFDQQLRSRFDSMREPDPDAVASPPVLMTFDLLYCDRRDLTARLLRDRRGRLEDVAAIPGGLDDADNGGTA
jgi:bifunctional non-homologous end joining protein LigD